MSRSSPKPNRGRRPLGPRRPCGWRGMQLSTTEMRKHFAGCERHPKVPAEACSCRGEGHWQCRAAGWGRRFLHDPAPIFRSSPFGGDERKPPPHESRCVPEWEHGWTLCFRRRWATPDAEIDLLNIPHCHCLPAGIRSFAKLLEGELNRQENSRASGNAVDLSSLKKSEARLAKENLVVGAVWLVY